ncbi:MAG: RNA-binding protein [Alphaproteobacteria bacterium]|nr:RNA-binding protein [Alphaproteobacteria bacterium]
MAIPAIDIAVTETGTADVPGEAERRCVATRSVLPKGRLIRLVAGPGNELVPDLAERLPGRGLWITSSRDIVTAATDHVFSKAARARVTVPDGLADSIETLLARRCIETLGLARRAGQAVAGFEKAREWLRNGRGHVILAATDAAAGGREKVARLAPSVPVLEVLTRDELGSVFGRDESAHAVVSAGRLAERLLFDGRRLAGFRVRTKD